MNAYLQAFRKYAVFRGRTSRREYWLFVLITNAISVALLLIDLLIGTYHTDLGIGTLSGLYLLVALCPSFAALVRRLHDTDHSAWWLLLILIPVVSLVVLVFACLRGTRGDNRFGPDPLGPAPVQGSALTGT
jgi:uncharacterized membrane protein YhaH (DUF805 family)